MCPSYMVTREEKHSTRGRAHLLFEMLQGDPLHRRLARATQVKEALDLCLACKGCKGDCPVNVDMATYKAEFLSHYYEGRLRPRHAYAFGLIHWWARLASRAPRAGQLRHADARARRRWPSGSAGIAPQRDVPRVRAADVPALVRARGRAANAERPRGRAAGPDTFNNHFHPETAQAAVEVLEARGLPGDDPGAARCAAAGRSTTTACSTCARRQLRQIARRAAAARSRAGMPIVGLEPSCVSVFRDELLELCSPRRRREAARRSRR